MKEISYSEKNDLIKLSYLVVSVAINLFCNKKISLIQSVVSVGLIAYNYTQDRNSFSNPSFTWSKILNFNQVHKNQQELIKEKIVFPFTQPWNSHSLEAKNIAAVIQGIVYSSLLAHVYSSKSNAAIFLGLRTFIRYVLPLSHYQLSRKEFVFVYHFLPNFILSLNGKDELSESLGIQKQLPLLNFHLISFTGSQIIKMVARDSLGLDRCSENRVWMVTHLALQILIYKTI